MAVQHQERSATSDASVAPVAGLTGAEARRRLAEYGYNWLTPREHPPSRLRVLLKPLTDPMVLLLVVAGVTYVLLGDYADAAVVILAVVPITLVSVVLERRAERTLESLRKLTAPTATVFRDGTRQVIPAEELVPGDIAAIQEGDVIPADGELIDGVNLMVDE